jgi:hypothetical protein
MDPDRPPIEWSLWKVLLLLAAIALLVFLRFRY